ncbi:MAG: tetratricopeptide repeat protein [Spirochaetia bacterium]|nr:tetratricopeptide repeat protein [Spirochaetia bacterium]
MHLKINNIFKHTQRSDYKPLFNRFHYLILFSFVVNIFFCSFNDYDKLIKEASRHMASQNYEEAKPLLQKALKIKRSKEVLKDLGTISMLGDYNLEQAKDYYLKAIYIDENYINAIHNMGVLFLKYFEITDEKNISEKNLHLKNAKKWFDKALSIDNKYYKTYIEYGRYYYYKNNYKEALNALETSVNISGENHYAYMLSGEIYFNGLNDYKKALEKFEKAYLINDSIPQISYFLFKTYANLGNKEKAEIHFNKYIFLLKKIDTSEEIIKRAELEKEKLL